VSLPAEARLGPYEILSSLGAGGMGEVYRARDTRLGREVAVKVLPEEFAKDPDRLRRFEGEARAASALSDPHIVTVFDVGQEGGISWFATELVDGTDLRAILGEPLPVRKVVDLAEQIAEGLAAAHDKGIVHRDLKPENVLIGRSGLAKIADFGLAKLTEPNRDSVSQLPTSDGHRTSAGVVMGTVPYMSPEQARGTELDFRSDQFAFGSVVYEMLTGKTAFRRGSHAETLSAILREEPEPIAAAAPTTPAPLRWLVERCLSKEPELRYASTADLRRDLQAIREHLSEAIAVSASGGVIVGRRRRFSFFALTTAAAAAVAGTLIGKFLWKAPRPEPPAYHQVTFQTGNIWRARFAPDGQTILYSARWKGGPRRTYSTRIDSTESTELSWPDGTLFSISSTWRAAIASLRSPPTRAQMMSEVALAGGAPREILDDVVDADWAPGGKDIAVIHEVGGLTRLEYPIGNVLFDPGPAGSVNSLRFSPDGRFLAFITEGASSNLIESTAVDSIQIYDLTRKKRTVLSSGWDTAWSLAWTPSGREIWFSARRAEASSGGLVVNGVDLSGRERVVARVPWLLVIEDIFKDGRALVHHDYWPSTMVYRAPGAAVEKDLSWLEFSETADLSVDGGTLLFSETGISSGAKGETFIRKTDGVSPPIRLGEGKPARLSPDGKWVISLSADASHGLVLLPTGAGQANNLTTPGTSYLGAEWFPDSRRFLVLAADTTHPAPRLLEQEISGGAPRPSRVRSAELGPISPDGTTMAAHGTSGSIEILPLDGAAGRPVANTGPRDEIVRWSGDGASLFVRTGAVPAKLFRLDSRTGTREPLMELSPIDRSGLLHIDRPLLTADGKGYCYSYVRFLNNLYVVTGLR